MLNSNLRHLVRIKIYLTRYSKKLPSYVPSYEHTSYLLLLLSNNNNQSSTNACKFNLINTRVSNTPNPLNTLHHTDTDFRFSAPNPSPSPSHCSNPSLRLPIFRCTLTLRKPGAEDHSKSQTAHTAPPTSFQKQRRISKRSFIEAYSSVVPLPLPS